MERSIDKLFNYASVQSTSGNKANFAVRTSGGTGQCINQVIVFPVDGVSDSGIFDRNYLAALTALSENDTATVDIYDYSGTDCKHGGQFVVGK